MSIASCALVIALGFQSQLSFFVHLQADFVQEFPVQDNTLLWSVLPVHIFSGQVRAAIITQVLSAVIQTVQQSAHTFTPTQLIGIVSLNLRTLLFYVFTHNQNVQNELGQSGQNVNI